MKRGMEVKASSYRKEVGRFEGHGRTLRLAFAVRRPLERRTPTADRRQQGLDVSYCAVSRLHGIRRLVAIAALGIKGASCMQPVLYGLRFTRRNLELAIALRCISRSRHSAYVQTSFPTGARSGHWVYLASLAIYV